MKEELKSKIIYEDEDLIVLNKPSGLVVHPFDYSTEYTLVDFLREHCPGVFSIENNVTLQDGRTIAIGGIVHKLDRDTSGVMVVAKNQGAFDALKEQFTTHTLEKKYIALVEGRIIENTQRIDGPLGRNKKEYKQSVNPINPRGALREAITNVTVLSRNETMTLVELTPKTGRTHQLRAHMAHIGHPIIGDMAYGSIIVSPRIMLHAKSLSFIINNTPYTFETEIPKEFQ